MENFLYFFSGLMGLAFISGAMYRRHIHKKKKREKVPEDPPYPWGGENLPAHFSSNISQPEEVGEKAN